MKILLKRSTFLAAAAAILILIQCNNVFGQKSGSVVHPEWSQNSVIYEVNIRQYTPEGTFTAFEKHLPELKKLGADILWLMPINPIGELNRKGSLGSYYSVKDYNAVNPEFGTEKDLKNLVTKAHAMGMHVIIDWVANHTAWDNVWVKSHPDFFTKDSAGNFVPPIADWGDVIDLNYGNKELWNYMIDAMKYWITNCDIDGFRCDVAAMVPIEFWIEARKELSEAKKDIFMLAEADESYLHQAFDMTYNWPLKDLMHDVSIGKKNANDLMKFFKKESKDYNPDDIRMNFTSNHDENTWNGTEFERLGDAAEEFAVFCGVIKGMPLIYSGQEAGMNKRLRFFDKDTIDWKPNKMRNIYTELDNLKKVNKALWNGLAGGNMEFIDSGNKNVLTFIREKNGNKVFAIFNFSPKEQSVNIMTNKISGSYQSLFEGDNIDIAGAIGLSLKPWQYKIYFK